MSYSLEFKKEALKEWEKLDRPIRDQFKKKIEKIIENPCVPSARLSGFGLSECYKIKLRQSGYRLVYQVIEDRLAVIVIGVGKRERNQSYRAAKTRMNS